MGNQIEADLLPRCMFLWSFAIFCFIFTIFCFIMSCNYKTGNYISMSPENLKTRKTCMITVDTKIQISVDLQLSSCKVCTVYVNYGWILKSQTQSLQTSRVNLASYVIFHAIINSQLLRSVKVGYVFSSSWETGFFFLFLREMVIALLLGGCLSSLKFKKGGEIFYNYIIK